ncbi:GMP synthase [Photobacterium gaetbulicola]|uniref:Putative GMP synthase glutamine amidotransferase subunit n=1 Tax=Photobacterium gaetbulicola Gung47 TaxID=658445 RepID=A0A0C5WGN8_9GAMM|nr:glutamine amidotransferase [Photobacterium gaetbulicola]AJR06268.1 putative GMP synthase glutamine amidotransferase subunit [Photobacterium gaetbulicola Gung47]PSU08787.1 GMP synthase [Photobacterium gaetbulicola]
MKLGVLLCDDVRPELQPKHGNYPAMFSNLFAAVDPSIALQFYRVIDGQYPQSLSECDGYLTSGSRYSVYEQNRWINVFQGFVHQLYFQHKPLVGICFGHQMMAQALAGEVIQSDRGWGIGATQVSLDVPLIQQPPWLTEQPSKITLLVSHQDQVIRPPENSTILAGSDFCPNSMMLVGEHFLGIQGHPEFTPEYLFDLIKFRKSTYPALTYQNAVDSLEQPTDHLQMTQWIIQFFRYRQLLSHQQIFDNTE